MGHLKYGVILMTLLALGGCGQNKQKANSSSSHTTKTKVVAKVKAGTYTYDTDNTSYTIVLKKDGKFIDHTIDHQKFTDQVRSGTYQNKADKATLKPTEASVATFPDADQLKQDTAPITVTHKTAGQALTASESQVPTIKAVGKKLMADTQMLKTSDEQLQDPATAYQQENQKQQSTYGKIQKSIYEADNGANILGELQFYGNHFLVKMKDVDRIQSLNYAAGTYIYDTANDQLDLTITEKTPQYEGFDATKQTYTSTAGSPFETNQTLTVKSESDGLELEGTGSIYGSFIAGRDSLGPLTSIATLESQLKKVKSIYDVFPTADDFNQFVQKESADDKRSNFNTKSSQIINQPDEDGNIQPVKTLYLTTYYYQPAEDQPDHAETISIDEAGTVYDGTEAQILGTDDALTAKVKSMLNATD